MSALASLADAVAATPPLLDALLARELVPSPPYELSRFSCFWLALYCASHLPPQPVEGDKPTSAYFCLLRTESLPLPQCHATHLSASPTSSMLRASLRKEEEEQPAYGSTAPIVELGRRHLPPQHSPSSNLPFPARVLQRKVSTTSPTVPSLPPILRATSATSSASSPPLASALDDGGYFSSFRSSLRSRASSSATSSATTASSPVQRYAKLLRELPQWEQELRQQLLRHEAEELAQILHAAARVLPPVIPALRSASPRDLMLQEQARRWSICGDYYQLFLDTTELQELLHRRTICMEEEPLQRKRIVDGEVQHWIEARRLQVMRENQESAATQNEELTQRLAHFKHVQQQLYQVFLLEECERADRMEVERLQRLHVGGLAEVIAKEYRRVRRFQLRYEASRHPLRSSLASEITAEEGLHRSILSQEQSHAFKGIQAAEVRDYLTQLR